MPIGVDQLKGIADVEVGFIWVLSLCTFPACTDISSGHSPDQVHPVGIRLVQEAYALGVDVSHAVMPVVCGVDSCRL